MAEVPSLLIAAFSPLRSDARVLRQIRLFQQEGYAVSTLGYGPAPEGVVEHLQLPEEAVSWHKDRRLLILRQYRAAYRTAPVVRAATELLAGRAGRYDVVLADDIDTVPLALDLAPRGGVHADLHEYHPRQNEELRRWRYFVAPYYRWLVRTYGIRADSVTTVGRGIAQEYRREFGLEAGVVMNAPHHRSDLSPTPVGDPLRLVHAGNGVATRLEVMLTAMDLVTSGATLDLYLIDQGDDYVPSLRRRYADHPAIRIHDPVPTDQVVPTLNSYDVGVYSLPPVSFNFRWALPNKFFDFVQARLALLVGPSPEMAGLVIEHHLGTVAEDFTPQAFAAAVDGLTTDGVAAAKQAADRAAGVLCAEEQVAGWSEPVAALAERARR